MSITNATATTGSSIPTVTTVSASSDPTAKPAITFISQGSDQHFAMMLGRILAAMHANEAYPNPMPTLAELSAARDDFIVAINGNDRGRLSIAARNKARKRAEGLARDLSLHVAQYSRGDLVTLLGSGYPARRPRSAMLQIPPITPGLLQVRQGPSSGQIVGRCVRVPGALVYQWRFATVQAPMLYTVTDADSKTRVTLKDLVAGTQYLVQVRATGRRGSSDWSDPMLVYAV